MAATWWGEPSWVYTTHTPDDGLWQEETPSYVLKMNEVDRMVASGALGFAMLSEGENDALRRYVQRLDYSLFDASVLVAGAALVKKH